MYYIAFKMYKSRKTPAHQEIIRLKNKNKFHNKKKTYSAVNL